MTFLSEQPLPWASLDLIHTPDLADEDALPGSMTLTPDAVPGGNPLLMTGCFFATLPVVFLVVVVSWQWLTHLPPGPVLLVQLVAWALVMVIPAFVVWTGYMLLTGMLRQRRAATGEASPALHVDRNFIRLGDSAEVHFQHVVSNGAAFRIQIRLVCVRYSVQYASRGSTVAQVVWESETFVSYCPVEDGQISLRHAFTFSRLGRATASATKTPDFLLERFRWFWQVREDREGQGARFYSFAVRILPFRLLP